MRIPLSFLLVFAPTVALAQDAPPATEDTINDYAGPWQIQDAEAGRTCDISLGTTKVIGGYAVEITQSCSVTFPVMKEIAAWRMFENGDIVLADATRRERLRFFAPDDTYISVEDVDGIVRLVPAD
jgi:hypothetical protein